jgi:uncharacterized protein (TIGR02246 family)
MGIHRYGRKTIRLAVMGGLGMALSAATPAAMTPIRDALPMLSHSAPAGRDDSDMAALARLYQQQAEAWARGDGKAYGATYTPNADFVNVTGEHIRTGHEIGVRYQRYLGNQLKNSRILTLEEKIDLLSPTMALIIRTGCVLYGAETACHPNTLSVNSSVAVKKSGRWLIRSFHNTLIKQPTAPRATSGASPTAGGQSPR